MNIGALLKAYRQKHDILSKDLATSIGIDKSQMTRLEQGKEVNTESLVKLIQWLFNPTNVNRSN
jgi:transcriptional regulator with XRE-family HTH domain